MKTIEIKAFVPSKDYELSKRFYQDLGFELASDTNGIAYFKSCNSSFLLQDFYEEMHAKNFVMHLLVEDIEQFHSMLKNSTIEEKNQTQKYKHDHGVCMTLLLLIHLEFYGVLLKILTNQ